MREKERWRSHVSAGIPLVRSPYSSAGDFRRPIQLSEGAVSALRRTCKLRRLRFGCSGQAKFEPAAEILSERSESKDFKYLKWQPDL